MDANRVPLPAKRPRGPNKKRRDHSAGAAAEPQGPSTLPVDARTAPVSRSTGLSDLDSSLNSSSADDTPAPSSARKRRTSTEILADRLLIVATQGARALEPGASTDFEEWSA